MSDQITKFPETFPDQVLSEILIRLPTKSICRFKPVSKRWNSLISHSHFLTSYISHNPPTFLILDRVIQLDSSGSPESAIRLNAQPPLKITTLSVDLNRLAVEPLPILHHPDGNKTPSVVGSSNGLLLLLIIAERDPHIKNKPPAPAYFPWMNQDLVFVIANPVTRQWVPLPNLPDQPMEKMALTHHGSIGLVTRAHPITTTTTTSSLTCQFVVLVYQPDLMMKSGSATMLCFSSDTCEWVEKESNYMLEPYFWRSDSTFEFDGRLFWVDLSVGLITWDVDDDDIFTAVTTKKNNKAVCRHIPLPTRCVRWDDAPGTVYSRWIGVGGGGGCIQYVEGSEEDNCMRVWMLKDYKKKSDDGDGDGEGGWILMHKEEFSKEKPDGWCVPTPCFVHPFKADEVFFVLGGWISFVNYKTNELEYYPGGDSCLGEVLLHSFVIPPWPISLPPRFCAAQWKELGNQFFKANRVTDAICYYSKSIVLSPSAVAYANRAIAHIKLNRFREADDDCTQALVLDPQYWKVYARRAIARKELGNLVGSMEDLEAALKLEPQSEALKAQHTEVKSLSDKTASAGCGYHHGDAAAKIHPVDHPGDAAVHREGGL